jgi:hypothetical protein
MVRSLVVIVAALVLVVPGRAAAATLCVGPAAGCYAQLQPAVAAAHDGDTITIARGTYDGGVTIDKSIRLQGAGATKTVISGGGPVLTIGRPVAPETMSVSIDGVMVTGGLNRATPDHEVTFGGGILIPVSQLDHPPFNGTGATVSISNSIITGNSVVSSGVIPPGFCGPRACAFNNGGGIDNGGVLTLTNVQVTNNTAGSTATVASPASNASSGGIENRFASSLVMRSSVVSGNRVVADSPIADGAGAGGIGSPGALDIADSVISDNTVVYAGSADTRESEFGFAGGLVVEQEGFFPHGPALVRNTRITGNRVLATNTDPHSSPAAAAGGVASFSSATYDKVQITDNSVVMRGAGYAGADGGGIEVDSPVTIRDSLVSRNSVDVQAVLGAIAFGGGIAMFGGDLTLERTVVTANSVSSASPPGPMPFGGVASAFGGGISNGGPGIPTATLTLNDSVVAANRLDSSSGLPLQGGGIFSPNGFGGTRGVVHGNKPDDCSGC